jgi:hypothetical protein
MGRSEVGQVRSGGKDGTRASAEDRRGEDRRPQAHAQRSMRESYEVCPNFGISQARGQLSNAWAEAWCFELGGRRQVPHLEHLRLKV